MSSLYQQLLLGELPAEFSPEPTLDDARQILDWTVFYAETSFAESTAEKSRGLAGRRKARRTAAARKVSTPAPARKASLVRRVARRSIRTFPALEPVLRRVQKAL
jgi:hypothetical protein